MESLMSIAVSSALGKYVTQLPGDYSCAGRDFEDVADGFFRCTPRNVGRIGREKHVSEITIISDGDIANIACCHQQFSSK